MLATNTGACVGYNFLFRMRYEEMAMVGIGVGGGCDSGGG